MKIVALSNGDLGVRYRAHYWALSQINLEVVHLAVGGPAAFSEKLLRQAKIFRKKGPLVYTRWRFARHAAAPSRAEVANEVEHEIAEHPFYQFTPPASAHFSGFSRALIDHIQNEQPDYIVQMGAGLIPEQFILASPPILNLHPGILPGIRGMDPTFWALYYGREDWLGSTLHLIDKGIDTGKPLLRRRLSFQEGASLASLIRDQILMEMDLLRLFFENPRDCSRHDHGGSNLSIYRSTWSREEFEQLKAARWRGPVDRKYLRSSGEPNVATQFECAGTITNPVKPFESGRAPNRSQLG